MCFGFEKFGPMKWVMCFLSRTKILANPNPYRAPSQDGSRISKSWWTVPFGLFCVLTLFMIYTAMPLILRTIQLFHESDFPLRLQRCVAIVCLLVAAIALGVAARACLSGLWKRIAALTTVAIVFTIIGRYLMHVFGL